jgi:NAD+-dependent farnesol dehydrogenase
MKLFLTGGTGYLGSRLLAGLLEAGHQVTVLSRTDRDEGPGSRLRWVRGDLKDGPPPVELLHQHRAVLHAAAMVKSWARDPGEFDTVNVAAYDGLLERCYRAGVPKIVHTSSFLSLGPSPADRPLTEKDRAERTTFLTDYERTKFLADAATDRWVKKGLPVSTLYPTILHGPGSCTDGNLVGKMVWWIAKGRFPGVIGSGRQIWNLAYLPDVVQGHLRALERALPGQGYILGGHDLPLEDLVLRAHRLLGKKARYRHLTIGTAETLGRFMEWTARFTGKAPDLTGGVASVYRHDWSYDSSKAERDLGYRRTPLDEALQSTVTRAADLKAWRAR